MSCLRVTKLVGCDLSHYQWSPQSRSPRTKCGSHGWSPGPCMTATLGPGGPSTALSITTLGPP